MFEALDSLLRPLIPAGVATLTDAAVKTALLLLVAAAATALLRNRSAAERHLVWTVALIGSLTMPLLSRVAPSVPVPVPALEMLARPHALEARRVPEATPDVRQEDRALRADAEADAVALRLRALEGRVGALEIGEDTPPPTGAGRGTAGIAAGDVGGARVRAGALTAVAGARPAGFSTRRPAADPAALLFFAWLAGAALVLGSFALGRLRLVGIARRAHVVRSGRLARVTDLLSARVGMSSPPRLLLGDADSVPMTWGVWRPVVLLPEGALEWAPWRLEAVLRHELGHVRRRDYPAQAGAHLACALYWFNPLVWIAAHRLCVEREHACDDLVLAGGHDPADYAADLLQLARAFRSHGRADVAALGMARPAHLKDRLVAMLDDSRSRQPLSGRLSACVGGAALLIAIPLAALTPTDRGSAASPSRDDSTTAAVGSATPVAPERTSPVAHGGTSPVAAGAFELPTPRLPASRERSLVGVFVAGGDGPVAFTPGTAQRLDGLQQATILCSPADGQQRRSSHIQDDDVTMIETEYGGCRSSVRIEGEIAFNDDFTAIRSISPRGLLRVEVDRDGTRRRVEASRGSGGGPEYRWTVDGGERPFDADARAWLDATILDLFRGSSFQAEERTAWILSREGPAGVLAEVERMWSGHGRARYIEIALATGTLTPEQVRNSIRVAGEVVESDHALGEVLIQAAATYSFDAATRGVFLQAARSLESDHQQGRVFQEALSRGDLDREQLATLLEAAAADIESDHQLAEILVGLAERYPLEIDLRDPFLRAAATLESDHQQGRVYGIVLSQSGLRPDELATVLEAAATIESDHQLSELLVAATAHDLSDPTLRSALLGAANSIESSHNRARVYAAALKNTRLGDTDLATILTASGSIDSDHELAGLLADIADGGIGSRPVQQAYLEAAARIASAHNLSNVLTLFVRAPSVGEAELIRALEVSRGIDSEHSLAEFLIEFADRHRVEGAVRDAFVQTLELIESEHQHGRVSSKIVR